MWRRLFDAALIEPGDFAPDVFVFRKLLDRSDPFRVGCFAVEIVAENVVDHDAQFGNGPRQLIKDLLRDKALLRDRHQWHLIKDVYRHF